MDREIYRRMREVEDSHWWFKGRRRIVARILRSMQLPADCAILDVGCGTGGNLELLSGFGRVTGMEADEDAMVMARARGSAPVLKGALPDAMPGFAGKFDLIVLLDVLEHIEPDVESLAALRTQLSDKGQVLITVPAYPFLWSRHDELHHHMRRYVRASLKRAIDQSGLELVRMSYFNTLLFPVVAAVRFKERFFPPANAARALPVPGALVNRVLESILDSEGAFIDRYRLPFGVSLLALARNVR